MARVVVGSYEQTVSGFSLQDAKEGETPKEGKEVAMKAIFKTDAHMGAVACISCSASGRLVATGSSDETIRLFDVVQLRDYSALYGHEGAVSCVEFYKDSHMLSGAGDGRIIVWETSKWSKLATLAAHKGGVSSISIHPSGRVALSVGKDGYLKLWNLMTCTMAHRIKVREAASIIEWSPDGSRYAVVFGTLCRSYDMNGDLLAELKLSSKILSMRFLSSTTLAFGCDNGVVTIANAITGSKIMKLEGHKKRVRGLDVIPDGSEGTGRIITGSSDGDIHIWDLESGELLGQSSGHGRITCLVACMEGAPEPAAKTKKKKKRKLPVQARNGKKKSVSIQEEKNEVREIADVIKRKKKSRKKKRK
mmetsp:Transcript_13361/g.26162  ORF Transcript_13361/g.26162 Transcript_13361/m.26162 type:complete len:363 (+) Transcript_13361:25-1113(+)